MRNTIFSLLAIVLVTFSISSCEDNQASTNDVAVASTLGDPCVDPILVNEATSATLTYDVSAGTITATFSGSTNYQEWYWAYPGEEYGERFAITNTGVINVTPQFLANAPQIVIGVYGYDEATSCPTVMDYDLEWDILMSKPPKKPEKKSEKVRKICKDCDKNHDKGETGIIELP